MHSIATGQYAMPRQVYTVDLPRHRTTTIFPPINVNVNHQPSPPPHDPRRPTPQTPSTPDEHRSPSGAESADTMKTTTPTTTTTTGRRHRRHRFAADDLVLSAGHRSTILGGGGVGGSGGGSPETTAKLPPIDRAKSRSLVSIRRVERKADVVSFGGGCTTAPWYSSTAGWTTSETADPSTSTGRTPATTTTSSIKLPNIAESSSRCSKNAGASSRFIVKGVSGRGGTCNAADADTRVGLVNHHGGIAYLTPLPPSTTTTGGCASGGGPAMRDSREEKLRQQKQHPVTPSSPVDVGVSKAAAAAATATAAETFRVDDGERRTWPPPPSNSRCESEKKFQNGFDVSGTGVGGGGCGLAACDTDEEVEFKISGRAPTAVSGSWST